MPLSIRWRMTLWNALAMTLVLVLVGGFVVALLARAHRQIDQALIKRIDALQDQIDKSLLAQLRQLENDPKMATAADERLKHWIYEFKEHDNIFCVLFDDQGREFMRTEEMPKAAVPAQPGRVETPTFRDAELPILGRQRMLASPLRIGNRSYTVLLMASRVDLDRARQEVDREQSEVDHEFRKTMTILVIALPVALMLVIVLGYTLARKGLAPMERLHQMTEGITAERLERRLSVANPKDELGRLTQTINAMIARLEKSFQEMRRFTADASHELRTPLAAIRTETEVALSKPLDPAECRLLLESILEECIRLNRLTDQLLALAREDIGANPEVASLDLKPIVEKVVETMQPVADSRNQKIQVDLGEALPVQGDGNRLRQVLFNLLDNAIKYTPEGGLITVTGNQNRGCVRVSIRDTGMGIAKEDLPRVCDRFYRVDKSRNRDGTGLGLSIARSIITAHGGTIELESEIGRGTLATIQLVNKQS